MTAPPLSTRVRWVADYADTLPSDARATLREAASMLECMGPAEPLSPGETRFTLTFIARTGMVGHLSLEDLADELRQGLETGTPTDGTMILEDYPAGPITVRVERVGEAAVELEVQPA